MNTFAKTKVVNSYDKPPEMFPRNFKPVIAVALGVVGFGLSSPGRVEAVPSPQMHEMSGKVQRIDRETITIGAAGESKSIVFAWNTKETKFVRNGAFTTAEALHPGLQVSIRCSHPIFGPKPLLYRVAWQTSSNTKGK